MHIVYMSLGANIGDKEATLQKAITRIEELVGAVVRRSAFLVTDPWGFSSDNKFINAAICCATDLSPERVLEITQEIERELGRTAKSSGGQYHDRTIDIDLLLYDDLRIDRPELQIPHPRMFERDFVMIPLREIMPDIDERISFIK
ncbi:MAG: 2-amino-4-hydroxy-6-hydroxymethyldihydropteridine diphosphokinase [Prevotella sp.]